MKKLFPILFVLFCCTSCVDMTEIITIRKDGSGVAQLGMNLSKLMQFFPGSGDKSMLKESKPTSGMTSIFSSESIDTVFNFYEATPDSVLKQISDIPNLELLKLVDYQVYLSRAESRAEMFTNFNFNNIEQLDSITTVYQAFQKRIKKDSLMQENKQLGDLTSLFVGSEKLFPVTIKKGEIIRDGSINPFGDIKTMTAEEKQEFDGLKMLLGTAKYRTIYNLPGKAKKISEERAIQSDDKKTITSTVSISSLLTGDRDLGIHIKHKRR